MTAAVTHLEVLKERAVTSEGRVITEAICDGVLGVLYQRPRYLRNRRLIQGAIDSMCYRYELAPHDGPKVNLSPDEAERLLGGCTLGDLMETRAIVAAGVFAEVARNNHIRPGGWWP